MSKVDPYTDNSQALIHNFHQLDLSGSERLLDAFSLDGKPTSLRSFQSAGRKRRHSSTKFDGIEEGMTFGLKQVVPTMCDLEHDLPSVLARLESDAISVFEFSADVKCMAAWSKGVVVGLENGKVALLRFGCTGIVELAGDNHKGRITCIALSPDAKVFVAGSSDATLSLWSLATRRLERQLCGHTQAISCAVITHDGKYIVSGSFDSTVRVWLAEDARELATFRGHSAEVSCLAVNGKQVVSGSFDRTLRVWSLEKPGIVNVLEGHEGCVECLAVTSAHLISGSRDGTAKVWQEGRLTVTLKGHTHFVSCVCATRDDKRVVTGSFDKTVKLWLLADGSLLATLQGHSHYVSCMSLTHDEDYIVSGSYDKTVKVWAFATLCEVATLKGHSHFVSSLSVAVDGLHLASGSWDSTVRVWTLEQRSEVATLYKHTDWVNCLTITQDGDFIISASKDKTVKVWSVEDNSELATFRGHTEEVSCLCVTPDAKYAISASFWQIKAWSLEAQHDPTTFVGHIDTVKCLAVTPDSCFFVSGSRDKTVRLWSLHDQCEAAVFQGHADEVNCVAITPDGLLVVSGADDGVLKVWSMTHRHEVASLERHPGHVKCLVVAPNGAVVVSACFVGQVKVWSLSDMDLVATFDTHRAAVLCLCVTPDSRLAISGSDDGELKVWSLWQLQELVSLEGHSHFITCLSCTPNGQHLLSTSVSLDTRGGELKVWSLREFTAVATLHVHEDAVWCLAVSPDGHTAVTGSYDMTVLRQDLSAVLCPTTFVYPESVVIATSRWLAFSMKELQRGKLVHRDVFMARVSPHNFNSLHISAYYNQPEAFTAYLKAGAPILRGAYGSPLTIALARNSKRCVDVLAEHLTAACQSERGCITLRVFTEDLPLLLSRNSSHLIPLFRALMCESTQARLPQFIIPLRKLPITHFSELRYVDVKQFARFRDSKFVESTLHLVEFWVSLIRWNFAHGSFSSLCFLSALETCENRSILTTPFVTALIESKWELFFPLTLTLTGAYAVLLVSLVALVFEYWQRTVLCCVFLLVNLFFLAYEILQAVELGFAYWADAWNVVDLCRAGLSLLWSVLLIAQTDYQYLKLFVVLTCFLRGFIHFRTFSATRIFVFMMTQVIREIYSFLLILAYSVFAFGVLASVMSNDDGAATSLTIAFNLLMNNFDNSSFGVVQWIVFIAANVVNVIIMLNLLISIIGEAFEKSQMLLREYNILQMLHLVIEYESLFFWRRCSGVPTVLIRCKPAADAFIEDEWAGRINKITKSVREETAYLLTGARRDANDQFLRLAEKLDSVSERMACLEEQVRSLQHSGDGKQNMAELISALQLSVDTRMTKMEEALGKVLGDLRVS